MEETQINIVEDAQPVIPEKPSKSKLYAIILVVAILIFSSFLVFKYIDFFKSFFPSFSQITSPTGKPQMAFEVKKFASFEEYKSYFENAKKTIDPFASRVTQLGQDIAVSEKSVGSTAPTEPDRYSATNVQVPGIDEPDIVKTDGKNLFFSTQSNVLYPMGVSELKIGSVPSASFGETKVIKAFPLDSISKLSSIDKSGDLLLKDTTLVVISYNKLDAYDVGDAKNPKSKWSFEYDQRNSIVTSRLYKDGLYVVTKTNPTFTDCLIPLSSASGGVSINCLDVFRPSKTVPTDSLYTVSLFNLTTGAIDNKISLVGSSSGSVFYMSQANIYLTYSYYEDLVNIFYKFYSGVGKSLIPQETLEKLKNISSLDISTQSKFMELSLILEEYKNTLTADEILKIENETKNLLSTFMKQESRNLDKTAIVKIDVGSLNIVSSRVVPGQPLNQFSLDEYKGNLRIAQTIGSSLMGETESVNDVYVLDSSLNIIGSVEDLGVGERIYSVRFLGDVGYVVTFKQTDPFYVINLADPKNPKKEGELKIPGFSSYLHPLDKNIILGVGRENQTVKLSLFDVENPSNPTEISKYNLDEYWTEVETNYRAFLADEKNKIFFVPGGKGGYVFSYASGELKLVKALSSPQVKRAIYINNYFYIISENKIDVFDETSWVKVKELSI